jgi:predicted nucleic acid-binding protein
VVICYVDTSAAMNLLVEEAESDALSAFLQSTAERRDQSTLVASWLLHTELHCAANRHPDDVDAESVGILLETVSLIDVTRGDLLTAGALPGRLRSNDAIHLAVALRVGADAMLSYDDELANAAAATGLSVQQPR